MAATTHTHDYVGRELANAVPGTTDPVFDFLGREIVDPDVVPAADGDETDFLGRVLTGA